MRSFLAKPRLFISREGHYLLAFYWCNGAIEIVREGHVTPGEIIEVPAMTMVIYE